MRTIYMPAPRKPFTRHLYALATLSAFLLQLAITSESPTTAQSPQEEVTEEAPLPKIDASGVKIKLILEHPDLATPTGIDVAEDGCIWVVSNHTHFRPDGYEGPQKDQILRFTPEGTRTVFFSESENTMDLELGSSNDVYVAQRDKILRLFDEDQNAICERHDTIVQLETEASYPHNGLSGLTWSPDGHLVFSIGENFAEHWKLTGSDNKTLSGSGEGGIFSCRSDGTELRRIAKGFWNPFGLCYRDGELFAAENDPGSRPPCRLLHVVENGDYGYQRKYGNASHHPFVCWNGELRGTLPMMHALGEAPCGIVPLQDGLLVTSWTEHRLDYYPLTRNGESFSTKRITIAHGDQNFRPTCIAAGNENEFYFTDWVKGSYEIHGQGRVWQIKFDPQIMTSWSKPVRLETHSDTAIHTQPKQQDHRFENLNTRQLLRRADQSLDPFSKHRIIREVARRLKDDSANGSLNVESLLELPEKECIPLLLAWKMANPDDMDAAKQCLSHSSTAMRFETLRWIAEKEMRSLLPEVNASLDQPNLDFTLFEAILATVNTLGGEPSREIADQESLQKLMSKEGLSESVKVNLLRLARPNEQSFGLEQWLELKNHGSSAILQELVRTIGVAGNEDANHFLKKIIKDSDVPDSIRADAIASFQPSSQSDTDLLLSLTSSKARAIREESLRSLRFQFLDKKHHIKLGEIKKTFPDSGDLVDAILAPDNLSKDRPTANDFEKWRQLIDHVKAPVDANAGRRIFSHARIANCNKCHRHSGRGNILGPDLTNLSRSADRDRVLTSLLQPSQQIDPQYHGRSLLLQDGTTFTGILLRDGGGGREVYRNLDGKEQVLLTYDIVQRRETTTSLMPEGLLNQLTLREIRDLLAFLLQPTFQPEFSSVEKNSLDPNWFGDWWLDFADGYGGWFSFSKENPASADLLWRVGSPRSVNVEVLDPQRIQLSKKNKRGESNYIAILHDDEITISEAKRESTIGIGGRCPPMPPAPDLKIVQFGEPLNLFNGQNLENWSLQPHDAKNGWEAKDGTLVNTTTKTDFSAYGEYGNLRTKQVFGDCKLHIEFKVDTNCNSGIYINGLYEAQVVDRDSPMQGINGPGAIFGRIAPQLNAGLPGGQWQTYDITLVDRHITVVLNGVKVIDNQPVKGCTGGALSGNMAQAGPLYLQGDHTSVSYRNIWIRPRRSSTGD